MSSTDPFIHGPGRSKSVRNVRIGAIAALLCALIMSGRDLGAAGPIVCAAIAGLSLAVYGVATMLDATATFPRWLYAGIALLGVSLATYHSLSLL